MCRVNHHTHVVTASWVPDFGMPVSVLPAATPGTINHQSNYESHIADG